MKLKFKIAQSTDLAPQVIVDKIKVKLDKDDYQILNITGDTVEFNDSPWKLMSRSKAFRRLDGGKFEINLKDDSTSVTLSYYLSLIGVILVLAVLSIGLIANGEYYAPIFFLAFYLIGITINIAILKDVANEMLNDITN